MTNPLSLLAILSAGQAQGVGEETEQQAPSVAHLLAGLPSLFGRGYGTSLFSSAPKMPRVRSMLTPQYVGLLNDIRERRQMQSMPLLAKGLGSTRRAAT